MIGRSKPPLPQNPSGGSNPPSGATSVLAVGASFFGTPLFNDLTRDGVVEFTVTHYGEWLIGIVQFGWFVLSAVGIFFIARSLLSYVFKRMQFETFLQRLKSGF